MYTKINDSFAATHGIKRDADDAFIPADPANTDWQAYQAWLKAGNTPAEPDVARRTQPTPKG